MDDDNQGPLTTSSCPSRTLDEIIEAIGAPQKNHRINPRIVNAVQERSCRDDPPFITFCRKPAPELEVFLLIRHGSMVGAYGKGGGSGPEGLNVVDGTDEDDSP